MSIARANVEAELPDVRRLAERYGWVVADVDLEIPRLIVHLHARLREGQNERDVYVVRVTCDDYRAKPPLFEFLDPKTGAARTDPAFPTGGDSFFHSNNLICHQFNRGAYKEHGGPHAKEDKWDLSAWDRFAGPATHLHAMLLMIHNRLVAPTYSGPKGARP